VNDLVIRAMTFAKNAHNGQVRKYTGEPYWHHLRDVAQLTAEALPEHHVAQAVAWLHDTIEDQDVTMLDLADFFGEEVATGVMWLSDLEEGNRASRKAAARARLARAPAWVQTIKVADLINNTASIVEHDPKFAVTYLEEKRLLLLVLTEADPRLVEQASRQIMVEADSQV
jgi:guanosine-3',5'-bis(diphosphate) 3'-pyrophosphohydrolase